MSSEKTLIINGEKHRIQLIHRDRSSVRFKYAEREYLVEFAEDTPVHESSQSKRADKPRVFTTAGTSGVVTAQMPGVVVSILAHLDQIVTEGQVLLQIEAMKMQNSVFSPVAGRVKAIHVQVGSEVGDGQALVEIDLP